MVNPRDISKPLQMFRQALFSGRVYKSNVRFEDHSLAKRTQDQPNLPPGVSHKLYNNYYLNRDPRRTSLPPQVITVASGERSQPNLQLKSS